MAKDKKAPEEDDTSSDTETTEADEDTDALDSDDTPQRTAKADAFWEKVGVEPIEIAMPKGVGLTLRAYRMSDTIETEEEEPEVDDEEEETEEAKPAKAAKQAKGKGKSKDESDDEDEDEDTGKKKPKAESKSKDDDEDADESDDADEDEDEESDDDDSDAEPEAVEPEEIPIFLTLDGKLPLFDSAEELVKFVKSGAATDMEAIDTWDELVKGIKADYVVPSEDDSYELDLVVKNLRGGHDSWDPELMIGAGELARDLGYALRLPTVMSTLAVGSPLDGLDNQLRSVVNGGLKAMFAKRKIRKIGTQQTALAWRGIVNKINETVDWRN